MARGHVRCWAPSSSHSKMPTPAEKTLNMNLLQAHHGSSTAWFSSFSIHILPIKIFDVAMIAWTSLELFFCNKKIKKSPKISPITSLHRPSRRRLVSFALGEGLPRSQRASSRPSSTNWSSVYRDGPGISLCLGVAQGLWALGPWGLESPLQAWSHYFESTFNRKLAKFSAELPILDGIFLDTRLLLLFLILWNRKCHRFL